MRIYLTIAYENSLWLGSCAEKPLAAIPERRTLIPFNGNVNITYHETSISSHVINFIALLKALRHICPTIYATFR